MVKSDVPVKLWEINEGKNWIKKSYTTLKKVDKPLTLEDQMHSGFDERMSTSISASIDARSYWEMVAEAAWPAMCWEKWVTFLSTMKVPKNLQVGFPQQDTFCQGRIWLQIQQSSSSAVQRAAHNSPKVTLIARAWVF